MPRPSNNKLCEHEGCKDTSYCRDLCKKHYEHAKRDGLFSNQGICDLPTCSQAALAKGYCLKHYRRFVRHGDPETVLRPNGRRRGKRNVSDLLTQETPVLSLDDWDDLGLRQQDYED